MGVLGIGLLLPVITGAEDAPVFKNQQGKISYGIGVSVARDFQAKGRRTRVGRILERFVKMAAQRFGEVS
ncbi:MAG: hypothetical protein ACM30F_07575 [Nitrospirota bacterium]